MLLYDRLNATSFSYSLWPIHRPSSRVHTTSGPVIVLISMSLLAGGSMTELQLTKRRARTSSKIARGEIARGAIL